jgi:co-chaperonin GroES (HSP10)
MDAAVIDSMIELAGEDRHKAVRLLRAALNDPAITPEAAVAAQEKLEWYAREVVDWFRPTGYKLLVSVPYLQQKLENGLLMSEESRAAYQSAAIYGTVLAMGPQAFRDPVRFPSGPWCEVGDVVMFRAYSGSRFEREGYPFTYILINDDTVDGVIESGVKVERPR